MGATIRTPGQRILMMLIFGLAVLATPALASTWQVGVLDASGDAGQYCELQIDNLGDMYVVYLRSDQGTLRMKSRTGGVWQTPQTIDGSGYVAGHCALALDNAGNRRVSYRRSDLKDLHYAGPEIAPAWSTGSVAVSGDDIGQYLSLTRGDGSPGSLSVSFLDATKGSLLLTTRDGAGAWSAPVTVDPGPNRGSNSDHAYRPGVGYSFSERDGQQNVLIFGDPEIHGHEWNTGSVASSADDIGQFMSLKRGDGSPGALSLSFLNATKGSLLLMTRNGVGAWSAPVTVDPGPNRGSNSDHAYRPGVGYSFSEHDGQQNVLIFGDPEIRGHEWNTGTVYKTVNSGRFPSLVRTPDGHFASAFYHYDKTLLGSVYMVNLDQEFKGTVTVVVDSIGTSLDDGVYVDLAIDDDSNWHVSYRNARQHNLWYGRADSSIVVGIGGEDIRPKFPSALGLSQNYPNPFNPQTTIRFSLPRTTVVDLSIYDATGHVVKTLVNGTTLGGEHSIIWDGQDDRGEKVASGVYFMRLEAGGRVKTAKLVVLK
jgi:hypothetical protein